MCIYICLHVCMHTQSILAICDPMDYSLLGSSMDCPGKNTRVGCHFLLQRICLNQGSNPHLLHWQVDSLLLSHLGITMYMYITFYLSIDGHLGCFHILAVVNNAAINMRVQIYFQVKVFIFFG